MAVVPSPSTIPDLPPLFGLRQRFDRPLASSIPETIATELNQVADHVQTGQTVAITVGSRGIANLSVAVRATCDWVKSQQATPILVPAMGSHGGATGPGQQSVIEHYGCTEEAMGAAIKSSMDVVELPQGDSPIPVFMDAIAHACDHVIALNRIKIHTDFHGTYESGLMKMLAIGLGKQAQAIEIHRHGVVGMRDYMPIVAKNVLKSGKILAGVALVENAYDETMHVTAMAGEDIPEKELPLIDMARANMPKLPIENIDILIVDRIGKNISGVCMDTNIIGRLYVDGVPEPTSPSINTIIARDLTEETHGNALGLGLADIVTRRLADGVDWTATYENIYTSTFVRRGFLPIVMETDAQALSFAQRAIRAVPLESQRIIRIRDTLHLGSMEVTAQVAKDCEDLNHVEVTGPIEGWFNEAGSMNVFSQS